MLVKSECRACFKKKKELQKVERLRQLLGSKVKRSHVSMNWLNYPWLVSLIMLWLVLFSAFPYEPFFV